MPKKYNLVWLWLTLAVIIADQLTKFLIATYLPLNEFIPITPFFNIVSMRNTGAAFSFLANAHGWQNLFFATLALIVCIYILLWLIKLPQEKKFLAISLSLILGGACGNLLDRIVRGYVIDFLDFHLKLYHWPAFNIADSAIVVGAIMLFISLLCKGKTKT